MADTRVPIHPTTNPLYRFVGQLVASFPNGSVFSTTGVLISPTCVL